MKIHFNFVSFFFLQKTKIENFKFYDKNNKNYKNSKYVSMTQSRKKLLLINKQLRYNVSELE